MNSSHPSIPSPKEALRLLVDRPLTWLVPAMAVALAAAVYAAVRPDTWEASQALIVRNEAVASESTPGKFRQIEEMKTIQETILELARSRGVLRTTLEEVGPPADDRKPPAAWPSEEDVEQLRQRVELVPPKGAEFGKTEVFYLNVRDRDRARSLELCRTICEKLETRFQQVRNAKAKSMIGELSKTVELAGSNLAESTARLTAIEKQVGSDLSELRALQEPAAGDSTLQRTAGEIRAELRQVRATIEANGELLNLLRDSAGDPGRLLAAPNELLESQPALRRLKEGLVDAQLRTAALKGMMSEEHPRVRAALEAEEEIGRHLHAEMAIAVRGLETQRKVNRQREALLEKQLGAVNRRLEQLAELRATYANLVAENANRTALAEQARRDLAEARALLASTRAASLIDRVDAPDTGSKPIGPGRAMIVLAGITGGLLTGLGALVLAHPAPAPAAAPVVAAESKPTPQVPAPTAGNGKHAAEPLRHASLRMALERITASGRA